MKFLPQNRKKAILYAFVLLLASAGIIYINFFLGRGAETLPTPQTPTEFEGGLLPYGSTINIRVLNDETFKVLKPFPPVSIDPSELGKSNLFQSE